MAKACTRRGGVAGTNGRHRAAWPATLSVDRVSKGLRRLERRHLRGCDCDGLPGLRIATLARGTVADDELPESGDGNGLVPRRASPMAENTARTMRSAVALVADVSAATWETSSFLFIFASA